MSSDASTTAIATAAAETSVMRRRKRHGRAAQHVADAAHGVQQARLLADLGLASQVAHVHAERVGARAEVVAPDVLEDRRAGEHLTRMAHEHLEQQELGPRELEHALAAPRLVRAQVEAQILERERLTRHVVLLAGAPQQRAYAREQLAQCERLDEVVVGAGVEAGDAVVDLLARGEHQHRRAVAARAQAPAHLAGRRRAASRCRGSRRRRGRR